MEEGDVIKVDKNKSLAKACKDFDSLIFEGLLIARGWPEADKVWEQEPPSRSARRQGNAVPWKFCKIFRPWESF